MKPFQAFAYYNALKLHFNGSYDAIKYNFRTSVKEQSFWKRRDKYFFAKLANRFNDPKDLINYYVAHFTNSDAWIGDMLKDDEAYNDWLKRIESLAYNFEQDLYHLEGLVSSFDELFIKSNDAHPPVIKAYLQGDISLETLAIFQRMFKAISRMDKTITETIVWPDICKKVVKYEPFMNFDTEKMKKIILKVFTS